MKKYYCNVKRKNIEGLWKGNFTSILFDNKKLAIEQAKTNYKDIEYIEVVTLEISEVKKEIIK